MQIISDIISFIKTLSFVDVVFFFAVVALMLLIVTLIHFVLENKYNEEKNEELVNKDFSSSPNNIETAKIEANTDEEKVMQEASDLIEIAAALEKAEPSPNNINRYEEEQEEKAIISYDELLERTNEWAINYSEEENIAEDLTVKKVDLNNLVNKEISLKPEIKVAVISYEKEEAFLRALKELQQLLN